MSEEKGEIVVEYVYAVKLNNVTNETTFSLESQPHDTPEELEAARMKMDADIKLSTPEKRKLSGNRDAMTAVIEFAMNMALDPDDLHSIWATLSEIADGPNRRAPLQGLTDDGMIKYRNGASKVDSIFTKAQLKGRLERQTPASKCTLKLVKAR